MRARKIAVSAAALLACLPLQAGLAQLGGAWSDKYGRSLVMQFGGVGITDLQPGSHGLAESAEAFRRICLDTGLDRAAVGAAAEAAGWSLRYQAVPVPMKPAPVDIGGWTGPGATVLTTRKLFFAPNAQCNLVVALETLPSTAELTAAVTRVLGSEPTNAADATKRNGQPNSRYQPEWVIPGAAGMERVVLARRSSSGNVQLHFTLMERKAKSR
jgi:hypothetical protein